MTEIQTQTVHLTAKQTIELLRLVDAEKYPTREAEQAHTILTNALGWFK